MTPEEGYQKAYYVFRLGGTAPNVPHATRQAALTESQRLARLHPGATFIIAKALGETVFTSPSTTWYEPVTKVAWRFRPDHQPEVCFIEDSNTWTPSGFKSFEEFKASSIILRSIEITEEDLQTIRDHDH